jgi:hypothetical protein
MTAAGGARLLIVRELESGGVYRFNELPAVEPGVGI